MANLSQVLIKRLGAFLADLTEDRLANDIHSDVLDWLNDPERDLDHRLSGIYLNAEDFVPTWTAIRDGASLPATSWETVVLPTVVRYSDDKSIKSNLGTATRMWLAAQEAISAPLGPEASADDEFVLSDEPAILALPMAPPPAEVKQPILAASPPARSRRGMPVVAALSAVAVTVIAVIWVDGWGTPLTLRADPKLPGVATPAGALPQSSSRASPSSSPSGERMPASGFPRPAPSASPAPEPTQPPIAQPTAPRDLAWTGRTRTSVSLSWKAPNHAGSETAYYRVFGAPADSGHIYLTEATITDLRPKTTYIFTVRGYSETGKESPPSNAVTVTTDSPGRPAPPPGISTAHPKRTLRARRRNRHHGRESHRW